MGQSSNNGPSRPVGPAGGDLSGAGSTYPAPTLSTVASAATKGSASKTVTATINAKGLTTSLTDQDIAITTSQVTGLNALLPTADEKAAMDNANAPDAGNPFATIDDLPTSNVPNPTVAGQFAGTKDGVNWTPVLLANVLDMPPGSPNAWDIEFDTSSIVTGSGPGQVTIDATTTEAPVDFLTNLSGDCKVSQASRRGHLCIQNLTDATWRGVGEDITSLYATGTNADVIVWAKVFAAGQGGASDTVLYTGSNGEISIRIADNAGTTWVQLGLIVNTGFVVQFTDSSNSPNIQRKLTTDSNQACPFPVYLALWRHWDGSHHIWRAYYSIGYGWNNVFGTTAHTKDFTEVNAFYRGRNANAGNKPESVVGFDFVRFLTTAALPGGG